MGIGNCTSFMMMDEFCDMKENITKFNRILNGFSSFP